MCAAAVAVPVSVSFTRPAFLRPGPLSTAILLHLAFIFLTIHNGLVQEVERAVPAEVMITLLSPQPATAPRSEATPVKPAPAPQPQKLASPPPLAPQAIPATPLAVAPAVAPTQPTVTELAPASQAIAPASVAAPAPAPAHPVAPSAPQPAAAVAAEHVQPMTVSSVEYVQAPKPEYPIASKRLGEQGKVVLRILINEQGLPERAEILQATGFARLDEAARQAALRAVFKPHRENGRAVPVFVMVPINFAIR